jgi:hypothetical protein
VPGARHLIPWKQSDFLEKVLARRILFQQDMVIALKHRKLGVGNSGRHLPSALQGNLRIAVYVCDGRIDYFTAAALQDGKRAWLVLAHHSAKSGEIGCQGGAEIVLRP